MGEEEKDTRSWYAARTRFGQELKIKRKLENDGIEHFIPTEQRKDARGKNQERPVISNLVFIYAEKACACALRTEYGLPLNYLFDYANHGMLTIPDKQMEDFIRVFNVSREEGGLVDTLLQPGDRVKVVKGPLSGVEGRIQELEGKFYVVVSLLGEISACARVPRAHMALLPPPIGV